MDTNVREARLRISSLRDQVSAAEWQARVDLAASLPAVRGVRHVRHDLHPYQRTRAGRDRTTFLINAHGMLFDEITASSLLKVDPRRQASC